jgi:dihydrofolate reductase
MSRFSNWYNSDMIKVIAGMTVSLDGFINDQNGSVDQLYADFPELHEAESFKAMIANTGAAIMGRNVYEMADPFDWANDDYEFQTPIFVLTHTAPDKFPAGNGNLRFVFVTEGIESAVSQAKQAAGDKDVQIIGGANTIQQFLNAGLCDELQLDIMPVLLGSGTRLLDKLDVSAIALERIEVDKPTPMRTCITYQLSKTNNTAT